MSGSVQTELAGLGGETDDDEEEDKNDVDPWWQPKPD